MEAVSYRLGILYADLATQAEPDHQILANGGAILRSESWMQIIADVTQHPVTPCRPRRSRLPVAQPSSRSSTPALIESLTDADDPAGYGRTIGAESNARRHLPRGDGPPRPHARPALPDGKPRLAENRAGLDWWAFPSAARVHPHPLRLSLSGRAHPQWIAAP